MALSARSRRKQLPAELRESLIAARHELGWSQAELGRRAGLPQMHISSIETGRVVPRYDTLLELVRVLGFELLLVPRELVPVVQSLVREQRRRTESGGEAEDERPLYELDEEPEPTE